MKKYYYSLNETQEGPFTLEELKGKNLTRNTLVWYEGLPDWREAGSVEELSALFKTLPPPIQTRQSTNVQVPNKKRGKKVVIIIFCGLIILSGLMVVFNKQIFPSNTDNNTDLVSNNIGTTTNQNITQQEEPVREKTPEELKQELLEKEISHPGKYLKVKYETDPGFFTSDKIKGTITNKATAATFKDIKLEFQYYSETNTLIKKEERTIYQYIKPGETIKFRENVRFPRDCKKIDVAFLDALGE